MRHSVALCCLLLLPTVALGARVSGTVVDARSEPFTAAALELARTSSGTVVARAKSDEDGQFGFDVPPGHYRLRVHAPELCAPHEQSLTVAKGQAVETLPLQLHRCVRVTGRALGSEGAPLAGGRVTLHWLQARVPDQTATTDAEGRFDFPRIPQGRVRVHLMDTTGGELLSTVRMTAPRTLEVRGGARVLPILIRGFGGEPLEGVEVLLVPEPRDGANLRRHTDARGIAGVPVQPPGRYRLMATWYRKDDGFHRQTWRDVELKPGAPESSRLELRFEKDAYSTTLSGRVRAADGTFLSDAEVTAIRRTRSVPLDDDFLSEDTWPYETATIRTDAEGRFTLRDLREGEYTLTATHARGYGEALAVAGTSHFEFTLDPGCPSSATGRVVDEHGAPVRRFQMLHLDVEDPEGRFHSKGQCQLFFKAKGFITREVDVPRSSTQAPVSLPDVVLTRGRTLAGRVVRADGRAALGYTLSAEWPGNVADSVSQPIDASGRFSLGPLPRDTEVMLTLRSHHHVLRQRVPPSHEGELTLHVPAFDARLEVRALSATGAPLAEVEVTAEGAAGAFSVRASNSHEVDLELPSGLYQVRVTGKADPKSASTAVPARFFPWKVQVPGQGTTTLELRAVQGPGALRVLLPAWSHCDEILVVPGEHSWPDQLGATEDFRDTGAHVATDDDRETVNVGAELMSIRMSSIMRDFSHLVPGTYTVFAKSLKGDTYGRGMLFREVIQVDGPGRQLVQVRFEGPQARELPW
ncbi:carboxypeptidase regulatory-like domain-containing protein [Pyxidicoccus fallax]|uniref:Carboxypeptidase regulatory-like domain-containing protein n=1 Tax=Pyxidicoccus fallax TaxID=394095 RepID=A0A848LEH2_9BACT|nr:carboxypeptidase-like regulatory domain-containing protein [Pyxidicoccus fallax]NMO17117.1 carboxypeptidase regulatory-like domain-containing protein [Pyxidicoccus fallax]NPC78818.1 carboxypeptidase regulatory-like domain-containing protein [Pyxidicoccus fallax]